MKRISLAVLALVASPALAAAQPSFSAGVLGGSFNCWQSFWCNARESAEARNAPGAFVGVTTAVHSHVRVGAELGMRAKNHGYKRSSLTALTAQALVRPTPLDGFWLRGGLGVARQHESEHQLDDMIIGSSSGSGRLLTLGALYEVSVTRRFAVAPHGTLGWLGNGDQRLWDVGIGLVWR